MPVGALALALALVALGLGSELLSFNQSKESASSAALIPFAATALVAPHSLAVLLILSAEIVSQSLHRRPLLKAVFNLGQHALGFSLAIIVFRAVGGVSFLDLAGQPFTTAVGKQFIPAGLLVATVLCVNSLCVSAVIALTSSRSFWDVWSGHARTTLLYSFLTLALTLYATWLSVNLGIVGTLGIAFPIIAVRQLHRTTVELTTVTEELLDLMVAAIEARDPYTSGHSRRVAQASAIIARALGLAPAQIERVTVAALLHDVGKIDEQFAPVLAKEGRLTPEEWVIMKKHPIRGAELVGLLSSLRDIVRPVRHHHENWDGTGYPDGLRGEQIPLASRIIMFADTLDAITTDRPYRKALGMEEARSEFIRFRGKQFAPDICDCVVSPDVWADLYECFEQRRNVALHAAS
jgi:putative nucleotidyltransferase with HDIG domain